MADLNEELTRRAFDQIWTGAKLDQTYAADYIHRGNGYADAVGLEPLREVVTGLHAAFLDGRFTVEHLVCEADMAVVRWRFTGTHRGEWLGVLATGKAVDFTGTSTVRLADGKIAEQLSADGDSARLFQHFGVFGGPTVLEANRALCRAWLKVWNAADPTEVGRLVSADFLYQASGLPEIRGGERAKELIKSLHKAFPDGRFVLEENVATASGGVNRWSYTGTHQGDWMGLAPTGKVVRFTGTTWVRTSTRKIVHQWCDWDVQGLLEQLGSSGPAEAYEALVSQ